MGLTREVPRLNTFNPDLIPYQRSVIDLVRSDFDYNQGVLEVLLSGSIGSAKSTLLSHLSITHCLFNEGATCLLGRSTLKDLKRTIWKMTLNHMYGLEYIYKLNKASMTIYFPGSNSYIIGDSWHDGDYTKFRSLELSMFGCEELTENADLDFYSEIKDRVGRAPGVKENLIVAATNPDEPSHPAYKYFIENESETRRVFYSLTKENPFLPKWYYEQLLKDMDPKRAQRMLMGQWVSLYYSSIYYCYDSQIHFTKEAYAIDKNVPIHICFDFNIGKGKPFSVVCYQRINAFYHVFKEFIIDGVSTHQMMDAICNSGILDMCPYVIVKGDASGDSLSTKSLVSDYDIIKKRLLDHKQGMKVVMLVPRANPPIKMRHNLVNAVLKNSLGETRLKIYGCKTVDEGLRLTAFKKGDVFVEDDSKHYQHCTTSLGYGIYYDEVAEGRHLATQGSNNGISRRQR